MCQASTFAQSPPEHLHPAPAIIDGAVHPEAIPDSLAFRLYFVALSLEQNPTAVARNRQHAHLLKTGLNDTDQSTLATILSEFRAQYDTLVAQYNDSAKAAAARNESADIHGLLQNLDALVQSTRDAIKARLTPRGAAQLNAFVLSEKKNIKMLPEEERNK